MNGSKSLQLISNTHITAYWISNYLFDFLLCLLNISFLIVIFSFANAIRNDPASDVYLISKSPTGGYFFLVLLMSSLNWTTYAYCWTHFFKTDVNSFIVLFLLLGVASFLDIAFSFILVFIHITNEDLDSNSPSSLIFYTFRILLCILFPNVLVKRELFNFRLRSNQYCIDALNKLFKCKCYECTIKFRKRFSLPKISFDMKSILCLLN
jgi:hypothetical protein